MLNNTFNNNDVRQKIIHWFLYIYLFFIPFFSIAIREEFSLTKLTGYLFFISALIYPRVSFSRPPFVFYFFVFYGALNLVWLPFLPPENLLTASWFLITYVQLLIISWILISIFKAPAIALNGIKAVSYGTTFFAIITVFNIGGVQDVDSYKGLDRITGFGTNANEYGIIMACGTLANLCFLEAAVRRRNASVLWFLFTSGLLAKATIDSASRSALICLVFGFAAYLISLTKEKVRILIAFSMLILSFLLSSYFVLHNDTLLLRLTESALDRNIAGREFIFERAWDMFLERPLLGWGPGRHLSKLGYAFEKEVRDTHNLILYLLTQSGIVGFMIFATGVWICLRAAWKQRSDRLSNLPFVLIATLLVANSANTLFLDKMFWFILAICVSLIKPSIQRTPRKLAVRPNLIFAKSEAESDFKMSSLPEKFSSKRKAL